LAGVFPGGRGALFALGGGGGGEKKKGFFFPPPRVFLFLLGKGLCKAKFYLYPQGSFLGKGKKKEGGQGKKIKKKKIFPTLCSLGGNF